MRHRVGHEYESSSMISSDLESTSFVDSEEDASSRITTTTGITTKMGFQNKNLNLLCLLILKTTPVCLVKVETGDVIVAVLACLLFHLEPHHSPVSQIPPCH